MAISIKVSNKVKFKVQGQIRDDAGVNQPFDFTLTCIRLTKEQINAKIREQSDAPVLDFLSEVIEDWAGVRDGDGGALEYSDAALRSLCEAVAGMEGLILRAYIAEVGAKEKN